MTHRFNRILFALPAALAVATVVGCGGDDNGGSDVDAGMQETSTIDSMTIDSTKPDGPGIDAGREAGVAEGGMSDGAKAEGGAAEGSISDGGISEAGKAEGSAADGSTSEAGRAEGGATDGAPADSTTTDARTDGSPSSDGSTDGSMVDASEGGAPAPLSLCTVFDSKFLIDESDAGTQAPADRTRVWASTIASNLINATGGYLGGDCSFSGFAAAVAGPPDISGDYSTALDAWVQQFLGCPIVGDGGALTYGLIPAALAPPNHVFTKGDLDKLSSDFVDAINNAITCGGDCSGPNMLPDGGTLSNVPPLTDVQIASIRAEIAYLQSQVSVPPVDSGAFSFSPAASCDSTTCAFLCPATDAGAGDASDAGPNDASGG